MQLHPKTNKIMKEVYTPPQMRVFKVQFQSRMLLVSPDQQKGQGNIPETQNDKEDYDW